MRLERAYRIHRRVATDLGGPSTPIDTSVAPEELERMRKRLWGPLASDKSNRGVITPRWDEYSLKRRLQLEQPVRRYNRWLIDTFWAGYPETERRELEEDIMEVYLDPAEVIQGMPFTLGFVLHQTTHLITSDEEFTARLLHQLIAVSSIEAFGKREIPSEWEDPIARETLPWWGRLVDRYESYWTLTKYWRGNQIFRWLGARVFGLHRRGRPLAGRFGDLYLFFRSRLPPTEAHLRWIDEAASVLANLRNPGDARPLEREEIEKAWDSLSVRIEALKPGAIELTLKGGVLTNHFFRRNP